MSVSSYGSTHLIILLVHFSILRSLYFGTSDVRIFRQSVLAIQFDDECVFTFSSIVLPFSTSVLDISGTTSSVSTASGPSASGHHDEDEDEDDVDADEDEDDDDTPVRRNPQKKSSPNTLWDRAKWHEGNMFQF
ncbi:hypothetical protein V6N13_015184 [Hibiscus sabdariffa]